MTTASISCGALIGIATMLAIILTIAWREFGRPRHALTWAIGFALAAVTWALEFAGQFAGAYAGVLDMAMLALAGLAAAVNTIGFLQRATRPSRAAWLTGGAGIQAGILALLALIDSPQAARAMPLDLFMAVMFLLAASTLTGRRRTERTGERLARHVLILLALAALAAFGIRLATMIGAVRIDPARIDGAWQLLLPAIITGIGLFTIFLLAADLADRTRRLAAIDVLTGLLNRRGFEEAATAIFASARRNKRAMALVLVDIDRFKEINDEFGHPAGDRVIQAFAACLGRHVARRDLVARIGGEEFAIIMADVDTEAAMCAAEVLRVRVARLAGEIDGPAQLSASFGITDLRPGDEEVGALLARADRALYRSKEAGRDRTTLAA